MEVIIQPEAQAVGVLGAKIVGKLVRENPSTVLGLATGGTPLCLYRELVRMHLEEGLSFNKTTTFNLDEYVGLEPNHPSSYRTYMWENLFNHIDIAPHRVHIPDGLAPDIPDFCRHYEGAINAAGGIDLQILGIGSDGHIGFNEPTSSLSSRTRIKTLTRETRRDNTAYFESEDKMPHHVITMGVGTIMESRICLLLAFGEKKAEAIAQTVEGPITSMVPASVLQMHPKAVVILDEAAASLLKKADYYRWVYDNKPDWQKYLYKI